MPIPPHPQYGHPYWVIWPIYLQLCSAIVLLDDLANTEGKEEEQMNHYMDFDPYVIRERNQQMQRELDSLRLQQRLREARGSSSASRFVALAVMRRGVMPLVRAAQHLAG